MGKAKSANSSGYSKKMRPALTPEAKENRMISLAMDRAEEMLLNGTAPSQLIIEFVKRGSTKARLEKEILKEQKELMEAKTQSLQSTQRIEELYMNALNAMRSYSGQGEADD